MRTSLIALALVVLIVGVWAILGVVGLVDFAPIGFRAMTPERTSNISPDATANSPPDEDQLDAVLADAVTDDGVIYERLVGNEALASYVATLGRYGPRSHPDDFTGGHDAFAYYINAYNAFVLYAVASFWPIQSVHDVHGWIEIREGFGFFYGLQFKLDGQSINLYDLEHEILRAQFKDARVHAVINCASRSCPPLQPRAYRPETLDATMTTVTREWVDLPGTVAIDHDSKTIRMNAIFSWFAEDFERDAENFGESGTTLGWIQHFLTPAKAGALKNAQDNGYDVTYADYNWSINRAE